MICPDRASCIETNEFAHVAQLVEHVLGKDGVTGSNPVVGSNKLLRKRVEGGTRTDGKAKI